MIKYPTFTLNLLDEVLSTADVTNVANDHYFYAEVRHVPLQLEKLFEYVLKTKPPSIRSINDIYRHVVDVSQYTLNVLSTISVRGYRKTGESPLALTDDQVTYLRTNGPTAIEKWESLVEKQIKPYTTPSTKSTKQKIRWTVKLTKLAVLNL
jgi:hypothetical protein